MRHITFQYFLNNKSASTLLPLSQCRFQHECIYKSIWNTKNNDISITVHISCQLYLILQNICFRVPSISRYPWTFLQIIKVSASWHKIIKQHKKIKNKYTYMIRIYYIHTDLQICLINSSSSRLLPWHHMQTMRQHHKIVGENTKLTLLTFAWIIKHRKTVERILTMENQNGKMYLISRI